MTKWATELEVLDRFYATTVPVGCAFCGGVDRCYYGCPEHEADLVAWEQDHLRTYGDRPATESEAHAEWHQNTGVPIWKGVCPWDCCEPDRDESELELVAS